MGDAARGLVTDALELVGLVAVCVGLGLAAAVLWSPLGPLVGGLALIGGLQVLDWVAHKLTSSPEPKP